jgi:demethylmenaquinone methyltransferase/2-methoxy-6-polyprenyl-1,4-benzoquinol methylase
MKSDQTFFGFKKVNREEKTNLVKEIFSSVAAKYDLMNDLMSVGIHRIWKDKMVEEINLANFSKDQKVNIIDVAGGTADISFRIAKKMQKNNQNYQIEVVDINQEMLDVGKKRAVDNNMFQKLNFVCCDGEKLSYPDNHFDFFTIAFGIRNFTNIEAGIKEAFRVLKPNGKFICLEFSKISLTDDKENSSDKNGFLSNENAEKLMRKIYQIYSFSIIPKIGKVVLSDEDSYRYLAESIAKFPAQNEFQKIIEDAGFKNATYQNLTFGVVAIHTGYKFL